MNSFVNTIRIVGMDDDESKRWYRAVAQELAANGASESLIVLPNGNAYEITYAVNVRKPYMLIYSTRFFLAGTYEPERYHTVDASAERQVAPNRGIKQRCGRSGSI